MGSEEWEGLVSGGSIGSRWGPWGTVIGAGAGLLGGWLFGGDDEADKKSTQNEAYREYQKHYKLLQQGLASGHQPTIDHHQHWVSKLESQYGFSGGGGGGAEGEFVQIDTLNKQQHEILDMLDNYFSGLKNFEPGKFNESKWYKPSKAEQQILDSYETQTGEGGYLRNIAEGGWEAENREALRDQIKEDTAEAYIGTGMSDSGQRRGEQVRGQALLEFDLQKFAVQSALGANQVMMAMQERSAAPSNTAWSRYMASKSLTAQNVSSAASILGIPMMATAFIQPAPGFVESGSDGSNEAWGGMISQGLEWLKDFGKTDSPIQGIDPTPMESASIDYGRTPDYYGTSSATTEASFTNWLDEFKKDDKRKFASTF